MDTLDAIQNKIAYKTTNSFSDLVGKFTPERREHIESIKEHHKQKLEVIKNIESAISHSRNMRIFSYPKLDSLTLSILSESLCPYVREFVTQHANTPGELLEHLAKDEYCSVRSWVANNPNTPTHVLELLAKDEDPDVRSCVAENPIVPNYIHYYLCYNKYLNLL